MTYCTHCGKEITENSEYCPNCGKSLNKTASSNQNTAERIINETSLQQHWVKRIIAIVVDSIIVGIATTILGLLTNITGIFNWLNFPFVMGLIYVLYFTIAESVYGSTIGKRLVTLKVEMGNGQNPSFQNSFIRNISKIHFLLLLLDTIGGFFLSKDPHQKYTDQIANTTVL